MYEKKYSAAERKKLKTFEWNGRGSATAALRAKKMVQPRCAECQTPEVVRPESPTRWTWVNTCTHNPYWSLRPKVTKVPKIVPELDEDGNETGDFIQEDVVVRTRMIVEPNIVEIPMSIRFDDGEAVRKAAGHGYKVLSDQGIAPMCEMYGCGRAWPTVGTDFGVYCSTQHAKLCALDEMETTFLIINDPQLQKEQLRSIEV